MCAAGARHTFRATVEEVPVKEKKQKNLVKKKLLLLRNGIRKITPPFNYLPENVVVHCATRNPEPFRFFHPAELTNRLHTMLPEHFASNNTRHDQERTRAIEK
uniref:(northern house mosquito) hypothetical protein n=1 Tax=Culex pipiens TaxID=7175 RepID=A0A8D8N585_CULPI